MWLHVTASRREGGVRCEPQGWTQLRIGIDRDETPFCKGSPNLPPGPAPRRCALCGAPRCRPLLAATIPRFAQSRRPADGLTSHGWLTGCVAPPASFSIIWCVRCATCSSRSPPRSPWCSPSWRTGARRLLILERLRLRGNGRLMLAPAARICQTNPEEEKKSRRKQISGVLLGTI